MMSIREQFVVYGEPASKANSRRLVSFKRKGGAGSRPALIKSQKALDYNEAFQKQCPKLSPLMEGDVSVTITIYYASRRPDLDESVIPALPFTAGKCLSMAQHN